MGKTGLRTLLGHLVTMAETLRNRLSAHPAISVMNPENFGPVTLFRVYPDDVDTFEFPRLEQNEAAFADQLHRYNEYNRSLFRLIQSEALQGDGVVISMTDRYRETEYGEPVVALKSYIMSPFSDQQYVQAVVESIDRARVKIKGDKTIRGD
jgi:glutamate/tyrosine decarboxylase-like PLP-dependent enzyme